MLGTNINISLQENIANSEFDIRTDIADINQAWLIVDFLF